MMLKINLLPYREARRLVQVKVIFFAWIVTAVLGLGAVFVVQMHFSDYEQSLEVTQKSNEAVIAKLDRDLGEIKEISARKDQVLARLDIIKNLTKIRHLPVHLLEEISSAIPEKVWITKLDAGDGKLLLTGTAQSSALVADFMRRLSASPYISNVELTQVAHVNQSGHDLKAFSLGAGFAMPTEEKSSSPPGVK